MNTWDTFTKRIWIHSSRDTVYSCWTTQYLLETWFLEQAVFDRKGLDRKKDEPAQKEDTFNWKWNNWDSSEKGLILEANGTDHISFTFGSGGIVSVRLKEVKGGTEVELTQSEIPTDEKSKMEIYVGCISSWAFWLTNLKAFLEHNITLHAKGLKQDETTNLVNS